MSFTSILKSRKPYTLVFLEKGEEILLGLKKRGFGQGFWNGFGGKIESGENIYAAAAREIEEECCLSVSTSNLERYGIIHFLFENNPVVQEVHVFRSTQFSGKMGETEEMLPKWWPRTGVPFHKMWPDDAVWYPILLQKNSPFRAIFLYSGLEILSYRILSLSNNSLITEKESEKYCLSDAWDLVTQLPPQVIFEDEM